jgi:hypothetical protein
MLANTWGPSNTPTTEHWSSPVLCTELLLQIELIKLNFKSTCDSYDLDLHYMMRAPQQAQQHAMLSLCRSCILCLGCVT